LRAFLLGLDDYQQMFQKVLRKLRDERVVGILASQDLHLDTKAEFQEQQNLQDLHEALQKAEIVSELKQDEEHSAWMVSFHDSTNAERQIGITLAAQPEY